MALIEVKVLKLAGETGLRPVGSRYLVKEEVVEKLISKGLVEVTVKEPKTVTSRKKKA